jgi:hypothetical protein
LSGGGNQIDPSIRAYFPPTVPDAKPAPNSHSNCLSSHRQENAQFLSLSPPMTSRHTGGAAPAGAPCVISMRATAYGNGGLMAGPKNHCSFDRPAKSAVLTAGFRFDATLQRLLCTTQGWRPAFTSLCVAHASPAILPMVAWTVRSWNAFDTAWHPVCCPLTVAVVLSAIRDCFARRGLVRMIRGVPASWENNHER